MSKAQIGADFQPRGQSEKAKGRKSAAVRRSDEIEGQEQQA